MDLWLRHKLEEELPPPLTECDVFGGRAGFSCNESTALTAEDGDAVVSPPPLFPGQRRDSPLCHEAAGHDVSRSHGGAAGAASHEAAAGMVFSPAHRPGAPTAAQSDHSPISGPRFDPLGRYPNSRERDAVGQSNITHLSVHGCLLVGLGRNMQVSRSGRRFHINTM